MISSVTAAPTLPAGINQPKAISRHQEQHQDHAKGGTRTDTQNLRAGHRITGQTLDNTARHRQHDPGD